jgi:hypothetical protein
MGGELVAIWNRPATRLSKAANFDARRGTTSEAFGPDSRRADLMQTPPTSEIVRGAAAGVGASFLTHDVCPHDARLRRGPPRPEGLAPRSRRRGNNQRQRR